MWSWIKHGLVVSAAVVLAASFVGDVHGLGDSLVVFRPLILLGCFAVSGLAWRAISIRSRRGRALPWFKQATATERVGPLVRTFDLFGYPLGIDHILVTGGKGTLSVRPQLGSDHFGLLASVVFRSRPISASSWG
ncbi:hypothetical protein OAN307_c20480 [Octadecabacter antarcticus 307]|uniref:Uncharacterized protein n=1 Tax=Octadecabacter antarcticus 307 TaxID=391626 RepID=M9R637_9RHOB|nr:hypothetical protein [Octadecabacter antarcticus]AGI67687.1 hypothetical protein OAN307_c20480 [Octadecabacter antarcticus 307]